MDINKKIGHIISLKRKEAGYTQTDLADFLGVTLKQYQRYESGISKFSLDKAFSLTNILDLSLDELYKSLKKYSFNKIDIIKEQQYTYIKKNKISKESASKFIEVSKGILSM